MSAFATPIERAADGTLTGPLRGPRQMLAAQTYEGHASIHDDATAQKLGFRGGTIEGPTHFTQFAPLCVSRWGEAWFETGCLSAHYRNPVFEGEEVRAILGPEAGDLASIRMERSDGTEILTGTASIGRDTGPTALETRLAGLKTPGDLVILKDVALGATTNRIPVRMGRDDHMGDLYPFSLADKLKVISEPSPVYEGDGAIIPIEMVSVLLSYQSRREPFPARGPAVGLFADQEIRFLEGPLRVGEDYEIVREVVALTGSRRTESMWVKTRVYRPGSDTVVATMLLNHATMKASYAKYDADYADLYGAPAHA